MMKHMTRFAWTLPVLLAIAPVADGQAFVDTSPAPHARFETWAETLPAEFATPRPPTPKPRSPEWPDAFVTGLNVRDLGPATPQMTAAADLRAAERYGHVRPGPARLGFVRDLTTPLVLPDGRVPVRDPGNGERA